MSTVATGERRITVNGAFRAQRRTGQQRYAQELADELLRHPDVSAVDPGPRTAASTLATWAWVLGPLTPATSRGVLVSLTSRAPAWHPRHVVVVHDLFVLTDPGWYSRSYVATHAPLLRASLRGARAVIAVSEPVADEVRNSGLTAAEVVVAPNAPSEVFTRGSEPHGALERRGLAHGGYLLVVASRDPRKNLARLAEAYGRLPAPLRAEVPLVVAGGSAGIFAGTDAAWPEGTVRTGYITDEELAALYRGARGVVFPSLAEGFGLPIVEAAVSGARLAVSDLPVFHWIAGDRADYFDPTSIDEITAALGRLAEADAHLGAVVRGPAAADAAAIADRFSWRRSADEVLAVARRVAAS